MRRLIESLTPGDRPIAWTWIGAVFAFYLLAMAGAVTFVTGHRSTANLPHEPGATVAAGAKPSAARGVGVTRSLHHLANFQDEVAVTGRE